MAFKKPSINRVKSTMESLQIYLRAERKFGKSWESFFLKYPVKYFKTHDKYYWDVIGDSRRNIALVEVRTLAGTEASATNNVYKGIGANYAPFFAVFAEDYFHKGEVIYGEKNEKGAILRIRSEKPVMEGRNLFATLAPTKK